MTVRQFLNFPLIPHLSKVSLQHSSIVHCIRFSLCRCYVVVSTDIVDFNLVLSFRWLNFQCCNWILLFSFTSTSLAPCECGCIHEGVISHLCSNLTCEPYSRSTSWCRYVRSPSCKSSSSLAFPTRRWILHSP